MDYYEFFFTFIVSLFVVLTIMTLLWHINYNKAIKSSRCYKPSTMNNKISLVAKDKYENSMYKIKYDLKKRKAHIQCACKEGDIVNNFDINYFDINKYKNEKRTLPCSCSEQFDFIDELNTYYYGTPGLVRYMETKDISVFDPAYEE
jgi:hypothetical protein